LEEIHLFWEWPRMGWFSRKDWNVIAVIFERADLFQVNGQRKKGGDADKARDGAKAHPRTLYWAVFDQKGAFVDGGPGAGARTIPAATLTRLQKELPTTRTVQDILKALETDATDKVARTLVWGGYPKKE